MCPIHPPPPVSQPWYADFSPPGLEVQYSLAGVKLKENSSLEFYQA